MKNKEFYSDYIQAFLKQNAKLNLISKNDEQFLWEKHIFDSLAISSTLPLWEGGNLRFPGGINLLDIGTGGGFPAIPIALTYPEIQVYALDSIRKKINAIEEIKSELKIENLHTICDRAENIKDKFNIITSRAVAKLNVLLGYGLPLLKPGGFFIAYKSVKTQEEIDEAKYILKKYNAKVTDIIEYHLPMDENFTRNLIVIKLI